MTTHNPPLRPASILAILLFDWAVFAITLNDFDYWLGASVFGALATAVTIALIEGQRSARKPVVSWSLLAGLAVAVPLPLLGTVAAVALLIWTAIAQYRGRSHRDSIA